MFDEKTLLWEGQIDSARYEDFKRLLPGLPKDGVVRFRNSPGGIFHLATGIFLAINHQGVRVEMEGVCASACATVFLLSQRRSLSPKADLDDTFLVIHGSYDPQTMKLVRTPETDEVRAEMLLHRTGQRFRRDLFMRAVETAANAGGLFIYMRPQRHAGGSAYVFFCEGSEWLKPYSCEAIPGETPISLGIVDRVS